MLDTAVMDSTNDHPRTSTDPAQRLIDSIAAGTGVPADLFAADAVLDATVPNWRYETSGGAAISRELSTWYRDPATIDKVVRRPIPGGVAIELDFSWEDGGVPHASHQLHLLTFNSSDNSSGDGSGDSSGDGRAIVAHTAFCGGRWSADLLAEMEAARVR